MAVIDWQQHSSRQIQLQYRALAHMVSALSLWADVLSEHHSPNVVWRSFVGIASIRLFLNNSFWFWHCYLLLTLYWAQDGCLFTSCRAENFKMEDQKWACVLNMEYQWNACMEVNAINCKMCRNEFEIDLSDLSMFFYSGFHIYPGECQSHTHKTKS